MESKMMKKIVLTLVVLLGLPGIGALTVSAQVIDGLEFTIPFDFTIADKSYPAGKYVIAPFGNFSEGVYALHDLDHRRESVFIVENKERAVEPKRSELIFNKIGDHYFLSEIFEEGNATGEQVPEPRLEKRLTKALEKERGVAQLVEVFADAVKTAKMS
jgi:hypothetical protein